jgi:hypothetical protein
MVCHRKDYVQWKGGNIKVGMNVKDKWSSLLFATDSSSTCVRAGGVRYNV